MLYHFSLIGGVRQDREYYSVLLRCRSNGLVADDSMLRRAYDVVDFEALLKVFHITLIRRPIHWDEYSAGDDPC